MNLVGDVCGCALYLGSTLMHGVRSVLAPLDSMGYIVEAIESGISNSEKKYEVLDALSLLGVLGAVGGVLLLAPILAICSLGLFFLSRLQRRNEELKDRITLVVDVELIPEKPSGQELTLHKSVEKLIDVAIGLRDERDQVVHEAAEHENAVQLFEKIHAEVEAIAAEPVNANAEVVQLRESSQQARVVSEQQEALSARVAALQKNVEALRALKEQVQARKKVDRSSRVVDC